MDQRGDTPKLHSATIRIDHLPATGRSIEITATTDECKHIADFLELIAVDSLTATLEAKPFRGGIRVQGELRASVVQASVVSFSPVPQTLIEPIDRIFLPGVSGPAVSAPGKEVFVDLEGDDLPDPLEGPEADLSDLVLEILSLGLEPYPRLPDETIDSLGVELDPKPESPFAALRALRGNDNDDE